MDYKQMMTVYEKVAGISSDMLEAARCGDWDRLIVLESACIEQVDILKSTAERSPLSIQQRLDKLKLLTVILDNDRRIREITEPWMIQLTSIMHGPRAKRELAHTNGG